jgi:membrane-bound metal-dependent hydrolase YbcI (DUF457 family)
MYIMPITPLHFGLALPFKIIRGEKMSVTAFCLANMSMDVEPIIKVLFDVSGDLHAHTHNFPHAWAIGTITLLFVMFIHDVVIPQSWRTGNARPWIEGIFFGVTSHVLIDALVHSDVSPLYPLSNYNPLYFDLMPEVSLVCFILVCLGALFFVGPWSGKVALARERLERVRLALGWPS